MASESSTPSRLTRALGIASLAVLGVVAVVIGWLIVRQTQIGAAGHLLLPLMFFVGPLALLTAVPMLLLARRVPAVPARLLLSVGLAWLAFVVLHLVFAGRAWIWVLVDLMPPLLFVVVPLVVLVGLAALGLSTRRPTLSVTRWVILAAVVALTLGARGSGMVPAALWRSDTNPASAPTVRVSAWDTYSWSTENPDVFYRLVTAENADVFLFQNHMSGSAFDPQPARDETQLAQRFPGYHLASAGGLLTVSRFPVVRQVAFDTGSTPPPGAPGAAWPDFWAYRILRTDLDVKGRLVSIYNVHFFDLFYAEISPASAEFYRAVRGLDTIRDRQFAALRADLTANTNPVVVSGNLNTLASMPVMSWFSRYQDANDVGGSPYPVSLAFLGVRLWKVDWTFTSSDVDINSYELHTSLGLSPHNIQSTVLSLPQQMEVK